MIGKPLRSAFSEAILALGTQTFCNENSSPVVMTIEEAQQLSLGEAFGASISSSLWLCLPVFGCFFTALCLGKDFSKLINIRISKEQGCVCVCICAHMCACLYAHAGVSVNDGYSPGSSIQSR